MTTNGTLPFDYEMLMRAIGDLTARVEAELTPEERAAMNVRSGDDEQASLVYSADEREQAMSDFETTAAVDALTTLADQIHSICERKKAELYRQCLEVYYATEELARDPANAHLIPHVEQMRRSHERDYGRPIPPKSTSTPAEKPRTNSARSAATRLP